MAYGRNNVKIFPDWRAECGMQRVTGLRREAIFAPSVTLAKRKWWSTKAGARTRGGLLPLNR